MSRQEATNTFNDGMIKDMNPLTTPNTVLTDCINGTLITYNGNEFVLQNDMGNYKLPLASLGSDFIPVGIREYGNIIYIISYNPALRISCCLCVPCGTAQHGKGIFVRHYHGKRMAPRSEVGFPKFTEQPVYCSKFGPYPCIVIRLRRHGHQAPDAYVSICPPCPSGQVAAQLLRCPSALGLLHGNVHLKEDIDGPVVPGGFAVYHGQQNVLSCATVCRAVKGDTSP